MCINRNHVWYIPLYQTIPEEAHALYLFLFVPVHSVQNQDLLWSPADDEGG